MDFSKPADARTIQETMTAVSERGIKVELVKTRPEALERLKSLIPAGASLNTGASLTLKEIGLETLLKNGDHPWRNLKAEVLAEPDPAKQAQLRRQSILADWFLGSVHAVAKTGQLVIASNTGSQLAPYAFAASNVVWIVGIQKLVPTVEDGVRRIKEYIYPHEDIRMKELTGGRMGTALGKLLIFEREAAFLGRTVTLLLVEEPSGD